ncbi:MAG TPA: trypsin-like peptidase domain-containing protein [Gaiellaceae bacterium]|nr:trypsin-like peptidase domain-containing protein [Gaiellaceae bacterium]
MKRLSAASVLALTLLSTSAAPPGDAAAVTTHGIVDITTVVPYSKEVSYGTGVVLTPDGEVVTNNHVIRGATQVKVHDLDNNRRYAARIVGYSVAADVALLRLNHASGLQTIVPGPVHVSQAVIGLGNDGRSGSPRAEPGKVTGLAATITAFADDGGSEKLTGLISTSAPLQPGDSGGPLLDSSGRTIGIDTAGSPLFILGPNARHRGYAIPFARVRTIVKQIGQGRTSASVHVGPTAFLGLTFQPSNAYTGLSPGLTIVTVAKDSPAEAAGLRPGDLLTSINNVQLAAAPDFEAFLFRTRPGTRLRVGWTDLTGGTHAAPIVAATGPPQ